MLKKFWGMITLGVAIALTIIVSYPSVILAQNIDKIYVFGDSLSDIGNVYKATNGKDPKSPPYFKGRYTNGLVWAEYLASKLNLPINLNNNFAYGGATTGNSKALPPGLLAQIESFKANNSSVDRNALYIIWAGANDYLRGGTDTTAPINNLAIAVKSLSAVGAKNIAVVNLPDLGKLPGTRTSDRAKLLSNLTAKHNSQLAASLSRLRQQLSSEIDIKYIDVNSLFNRVIANPGKYGFKNVTQACLNRGIICDNQNEYLFWDSIHPSTAAHKLLVELAFLEQKPVPQPTPVSVPEFTIPLVVLVFGALGLGLIVKRRRKR